MWSLSLVDVKRGFKGSCIDDEVTKGVVFRLVDGFVVT